MGFWDIAKGTVKVVSDIAGSMHEQHKNKISEFSKESDEKLLELIKNGNSKQAFYAVKVLKDRGYDQETIDIYTEARKLKNS